MTISNFRSIPKTCMKFLQENYSVMLRCYEALMTVHFSLLHCHGLIAIHIKIQNYGVIE